MTAAGDVMTQYLVAIHRPDGYDPAVSKDEALAWGAKAVIACRAPVDVAPFIGSSGAPVALAPA
jgi:hypothetical protein